MNDFPETSYSLIERVKDLADGTSWREFLGIYQPVVYRMARRRGLQDADARDVVQQVLASVAGAIDRWEQKKDRPPFRAWLTTVTRNAVTKALTRQPRDKGVGSTSVIAQLHAVPAHDAADEFAEESRREIVYWAADQIRNEFTKTTWKIFWDSSIEGKKIDAIANETGRSMGAIYVARHRVLARLKEKVTEASQNWDDLDPPRKRDEI